MTTIPARELPTIDVNVVNQQQQINDRLYLYYVNTVNTQVNHQKTPLISTSDAYTKFIRIKNVSSGAIRFYPSYGLIPPVFSEEYILIAPGEVREFYVFSNSNALINLQSLRISTHDENDYGGLDVNVECYVPLQFIG